MAAENVLYFWTTQASKIEWTTFGKIFFAVSTCFKGNFWDNTLNKTNVESYKEPMYNLFSGGVILTEKIDWIQMVQVIPGLKIFEIILKTHNL